MSTRGPALPDSPVTRPEQFAFLRNAHEGPLIWERACLQVTRTAAGLPAVQPTARAAAYATPRGHRVREVHDLRRGMALYFGDPNDSNPADHVVTVAGWRTPEPTDDLDDLLTWTNDAQRVGGIDLVRASFFPREWGDPMMFGAVSLNGFDLPGYQTGRPAPPTLAGALDRAIADTRAALREHREAGHRRLVEELAQALAELKDARKKFR